MRKPPPDSRRSDVALIVACAWVAFAGCNVGVIQSQDGGGGEPGMYQAGGPSDESSDGGSGDRGAVVADGGHPDAGAPDTGSDAGLEDGGPCADYAAHVGQLLGAAQPCAHTSECTVIETPCGLPGVCTGGVCTQGPGAGETCGEATDCPVPVFGTHVPHCLTDGGFAGGYCVQECAHGWGCDVPDARCRALPDNPYEPGYCFLDCSTDSDCRVGEGYRCCPSWDGSGEPGSVCYPGPCPSR